MKSSTYTVTDVAQKVVAAEPARRTVYLNIIGNKVVYIGASNVTSASGYPVTKHTVGLTLDVPHNEEVWAICATAESDDLRVLTPND